jgi:F-type H+-transporting ATPase subunit delta
MKRDKKIIRFAKKLVELSKDERGVITEAQVEQVLAGLKSAKPRGLLGIFKTYLNFLRRELAAQTAVVASPGELSAATLEQIATAFSARYDRPVQAQAKHDPSLIAGVRVRVGDDVYDASVAGRLRRLAENVH